MMIIVISAKRIYYAVNGHDSKCKSLYTIHTCTHIYRDTTQILIWYGIGSASSLMLLLLFLDAAAAVVVVS